MNYKINGNLIPIKTRTYSLEPNDFLKNNLVLPYLYFRRFKLEDDLNIKKVIDIQVIDEFGIPLPASCDKTGEIYYISVCSYTPRATTIYLSYI